MSDQTPDMPDLWWCPSMGRFLARHENSGGEHLVWIVQMTHESLRHHLGTGSDSNPPLPADAERLVPEKDPAKRQDEEIALASLEELAKAVEDLFGPRYHGEVRKLSALNLVVMAAEELQRRNPVEVVRKAESDARGRVRFPEPLNRHGRWNYLGGEFRWEHWRVEPGDPS